MEKVSKAIEKVGNEGGFTYIMDLASGSIVFKGAGSVDILPEVKKELGIPASKTVPTQFAPQQQPQQ